MTAERCSGLARSATARIGLLFRIRLDAARDFGTTHARLTKENLVARTR